MRDVPENPTVCCILLTRDRPEMAKRAVRCFREQTYGRKRLLIYDNGAYPSFTEYPDYPPDVLYHHIPRLELTIGALRNEATEFAEMGACPGKLDIIAHWDDDDTSGPNRISEQVALLEASGADVVGYRECLFWMTVPQSVKERYTEVIKRHPPDSSVPIPSHLRLREDEAWLYSNPDPRYCIGSSLMYRREAWERQPFNENLSPTGRGEDHEFWRGLKSVGVSSFGACGCHEPSKEHEPRMICSIHAGNAKHYPIETLENSPSWKRVPEWDSHCRKVMQL